MTTRTNQILATRSAVPLLIGANQVRNVPTGLIIDGLPVTPHIVDLDGPCPFLEVIQKNADGSFDVWNPTLNNDVPYTFVAHHLHSEESEPIPAVNLGSGGSIVPPPVLCSLPSRIEENPLSVHNRYSQDVDIQIPSGPLPYVCPLETVATLYESDPLLPCVEWDNGRFIIQRSGLYQIIATYNALVTEEEDNTILSGFLCSNPDAVGGPASPVLPLYKSTRMDVNGVDSANCTLEAILPIDVGVIPVAQRTFELWMIASQTPALSTGDANGVMCADIQVVRLRDYSVPT